MVDVVARQRAIGIDVVNDGEFRHPMDADYNFGSWWTYVFSRLDGIELMEVDHIAEVPASMAPARDGELVLASFAERRDWIGSPMPTRIPRGVALPGGLSGWPICRGRSRSGRGRRRRTSPT